MPPLPPERRIIFSSLCLGLDSIRFDTQVLSHVTTDFNLVSDERMKCVSIRFETAGVLECRGDGKELAGL